VDYKAAVARSTKVLKSLSEGTIPTGMRSRNAQVMEPATEFLPLMLWAVLTVPAMMMRETR
jgi:hypothetical protein